MPASIIPSIPTLPTGKTTHQSFTMPQLGGWGASTTGNTQEHIRAMGLWKLDSYSLRMSISFCCRNGSKDRELLPSHTCEGAGQIPLPVSPKCEGLMSATSFPLHVTDTQPSGGQAQMLVPLLAIASCPLPHHHSLWCQGICAKNIPLATLPRAAKTTPAALYAMCP